MNGQMNIFDYEINTCRTCDCYNEVWGRSYCICFSDKSIFKGRMVDEDNGCPDWEERNEQ